MNNFTAVIKHDDNWWYGWIEEVPGVNAPEQSREELTDALRECLSETIEMNRRDALGEDLDIPGGRTRRMLNARLYPAIPKFPINLHEKSERTLGYWSSVVDGGSRLDPLSHLTETRINPSPTSTKFAPVCRKPYGVYG